MRYQPLSLRVWGDFACFTRPEMKAERVSYPVMTPSAARGILEAIFWKPQFSWQVREIWVLTPIRFFSIMRNEVNHKASVQVAGRWAPREAYFAEDQENRAQRHTLALRNVDYVVRADVAIRGGVSDDPAKFRDQFRRRVSAGACAFTPYLGNREFAASFGPVRGDEKPEAINEDLGRMLFDIAYSSNRDGRGRPQFFEARLQAGVLKVPAYLYGGN